MNTRLLLLFLIISNNLIAQCISGDCDNGEGTYIYQDKSTYTGDFVGGLAEGYGICQYTNGNRYMGHWKKHKFHGEGVFYKKEDDNVKGLWEDGKLTKLLKIENDNAIPKVWAIVVGVASYNHLRRLKFTDDDAYKMYAFLKSPEGGAITDKQAKILIDESATKQNIIQTMRSIAKKASYNDVIIFYFSGHGDQDSFLPYDFDGDDINKLTFNEVNTILGLSKASRKICIADACHSGGLVTAKGKGFDGNVAKNYFSLSKKNAKTAILVSSQAGEVSMENATLRQGTFSYFLLKGLKGNADRDRDNVVTITELYNYVSRQVKSYSRNDQNPALFGTYDKDMPIAKVRGHGRLLTKKSP